MMRRRGRRMALAALFGAIFGGGGCGGNVVLNEGEVSESGAAPGGIGGADCEADECEGLGTLECGCARVCGEKRYQVSCAPNEGAQVACACLFNDVFLGSCFETQKVVCNVDLGCCAAFLAGK